MGDDEDTIINILIPVFATYERQPAVNVIID